jgi:hypothetical protein
MPRDGKANQKRKATMTVKPGSKLPRKEKTMRQHLDAAEMSFDRAGAKATTDHELGLIKDRLANLLKEISYD